MIQIKFFVNFMNFKRIVHITCLDQSLRLRLGLEGVVIRQEANPSSQTGSLIGVANILLSCFQLCVDFRQQVCLRGVILAIRPSTDKTEFQAPFAEERERRQMMDLSTLADAIARTLSPDVTQRKGAEAFLQDKSSAPGFAVALLQLIALDSAPQHVRQATAVYMKNHTIAHYSRPDWQELPADDRNAVKSAIVKIMLSVPVVVRRQLSEVLAIVSEHEYPVTWPALVPELGAKLKAMLQAAAAAQGQPLVSVMDWVALEGILETLLVIFERYPERSRSDELYTEINYSLKHTQEEVQSLFVLLNEIIQDGIDGKEQKVVAAVFGNAETLCKVFYCLSWQQLPAYVEDNMQVLMTELRKLLVYNSAKIDAYDDDEPSCVDKLHASVLEIVNHFAVHYDEEFRAYLQQFLSDAWNLLVRRGNASKYDGVVTTGIKFLTAVSRSPDHHLFKETAVLEQVCKSIVVPNIELREEDEELFEDNPVEYVRRDMEGSDTETRRRGSVELVKGLCMYYEQPVTSIFSAYVQEMLSPQSDWRKRDTAIYVVTALGWKRGTVAGGATETSSLINVVEFFQKFVMPELNKNGTNPSDLDTPIFTADLIKFVISFRNQIPKEDCGAVIMLCVKLLGAKEPVVRTYAAACIERILTVKDKAPQANGNASSTSSGPMTPRMTKADLQPVLPTMLPAIVAVLQDNARSNEYVMRLVLRFCSVAREAMAPHLSALVPTLVQILIAVTANPANPLFNHYLFEAISALIRFNGNEQTVGVFESALMAPLCKILVDDVTEFAPYVFQVFGQLMSLHSGSLPSTYVDLIGPILTPSMWDKRGYIPGMVEFIDVYIRKNGSAVVAGNQLEPILVACRKLLASKATDHYGFQLLDAIFETFDVTTVGPFVTAIFRVILVRLTKAKTVKLCQRMLCTMSGFVLRYGVSAMKAAFDQLQEDQHLLASLIREVWLSEVMTVRKPDHRKLCAIALTELACGPGDLCVNSPYFELWPLILNTNVALAEGIVLDKDKKEEIGDAEEEEAPHLGAGESYSAAHSQLKWAVPTTKGLSFEMGQKDPRTVLAVKLSEFTGRHAGKFEAVMQEKVDARAREAILSYMAQAKTA